MREYHATVCIEHGGDRPQLVISGGLDAGNKVLNDVWKMDVQSGSWEKVIHVYYYLFYIKEKNTEFVIFISEIVVAYIGLQHLAPTANLHLIFEI